MKQRSATVNATVDTLINTKSGSKSSESGSSKSDESTSNKAGNGDSDINDSQDSTNRINKKNDAHESIETLHRKLSLADQKRKKSRRSKWAFRIIIILAATIIPYWYGRDLSIKHTDWVTIQFHTGDPRGCAFISWLIVVLLMISVGMIINGGKHHKLWILMAICTFSMEQFLAGLSLLKINFWYSTYVVFRNSAIYANALNVGMFGAAIGLAIFAFVYCALLIIIKPQSRFNILTQLGWSVSIFLLIELCVLLIILFGGIITSV